MEGNKVVVTTLSEKLDRDFIVPLLLRYVTWVLLQAKKREIKTLYFLARDGYILQKMAIEVCRKYGFDIECRYLYCSRTALRMPSYHLIGDEAYDLLLLGGYYVTGKSLLERAELNTEQRQAVWQDCGIAPSAEEIQLDRPQLDTYRQKLRNSKKFHEFVEDKSRAAYPNAIGYLRQEGLFDQPTVAIVDSGWTGSMQRSLRQLLESAGFQGKILGFYFGMYAEPKEAADGTYLTYYFNAKGIIKDKILFCNNLFECLLQAPHGMTIKYVAKDDSLYYPQFTPVDPVQKNNIVQYVESILNETRQQIGEKSNFDLATYKQEIRVLIKRYMVHPTSEEAAYLGQGLFCDDVTEAYHSKLADPTQTGQLKKYLFLSRVQRKLLGEKSTEVAVELYWPYGTISFLPPQKQWWYRWNIYLWEWMRFIKH